VFEDAEPSGPFTKREQATLDLMREIQEEHEGMQPETVGVFSDLMTSALQEVSWHEIAESMLGDLEDGGSRRWGRLVLDSTLLRCYLSPVRCRTGGRYHAEGNTHTTPQTRNLLRCIRLRRRLAIYCAAFVCGIAVRVCADLHFNGRASSDNPDPSQENTRPWVSGLRVAEAAPVTFSLPDSAGVPVARTAWCYKECHK
jgi:hypothetical protein